MLSGDAADSSDDDKKEEEPKQEPVQRLDNPFAKTKLPNPLVDNKTGTKGLVFVTDYQLAEASKDSILEQHVKMTEAPDLQQKTIGGKKVCWNYRKMGRCNKGHKCPYVHDTDLVTPRNSKEETETPAPKQHRNIQHSYHGQLPNDPVDDDSYMGQAKRKKRFGVTNSLIPPKKALTALDESRQKQRPWTHGGKK